MPFPGRKILVVLLLALFFVAGTQAALAAANSWREVAAEVEQILNEALAAYELGDVKGAKDLVNKAYYGPFEKGGLERAIRSNISARRMYEMEDKFGRIKKLMESGAPPAEVARLVTQLEEMVREDANRLDGSQPSASSFLGAFLSSFSIIVREGFEAILILGAITAYLVKAGHSRKVKTLYRSAGVAVFASVLTALAMQYAAAASGASAEILEGVSMLLAVAVLFSVSYWMISKAEAEKWQQFIEGKVRGSLTSGKSFALWLAAFLAVYREGAETVLFYQALLAGAGPGAAGAVGLGFALGCLALVAIFLAVRFGSLRIPLKPFFLVTSAFLYYLAFVFAGEGMRELQEGGLLAKTPVPGVPVIGFLGVYPTWESLAPQLALLVAGALGLVLQVVGRPKTGRAGTSAGKEG